MLDFFHLFAYNECNEVIMDQTIFKRKEVKYLLNTETFQRLKEQLLPYLEKDVYPEYTICNLYFDTDNFDSIRVSMEKPLFKQKMRLRSYGIPKPDDSVFLELKKKYRGIVYKRRFKAPYQQIMDYLAGGELPVDNVNAKEIDYTMKRLGLYPKVYLAYDRIAFHGKEDPFFRLTFDQNIRYREESSFSVDGGEVIEDCYVMEIKTGKPYPRWLLDLLEKNKVYPSSYSKYARVYTKILKDKMEKKK